MGEESSYSLYTCQYHARKLSSLLLPDKLYIYLPLYFLHGIANVREKLFFPHGACIDCIAARFSRCRVDKIRHFHNHMPNLQLVRQEFPRIFLSNILFTFFPHYFSHILLQEENSSYCTSPLPQSLVTSPYYAVVAIALVGFRADHHATALNIFLMAHYLFSQPLASNSLQLLHARASLLSSPPSSILATLPAIIKNCVSTMNAFRRSMPAGLPTLRSRRSMEKRLEDGAVASCNTQMKESSPLSSLPAPSELDPSTRWKYVNQGGRSLFTLDFITNVADCGRSESIGVCCC